MLPFEGQHHFWLSGEIDPHKSCKTLDLFESVPPGDTVGQFKVDYSHFGYNGTTLQFAIKEKVVTNEAE